MVGFGPALGWNCPGSDHSAHPSAMAVLSAVDNVSWLKVTANEDTRVCSLLCCLASVQCAPCCSKSQCSDVHQAVKTATVRNNSQLIVRKEYLLICQLELII